MIQKIYLILLPVEIIGTDTYLFINFLLMCQGTVLYVSVCVRGWFFDTLQEYIFTLLNRHQRLKELVFYNFSECSWGQISILLSAVKRSLFLTNFNSNSIATLPYNRRSFQYDKLTFSLLGYYFS